MFEHKNSSRRPLLQDTAELAIILPASEQPRGCFLLRILHQYVKISLGLKNRTLYNLKPI